MPLIHDKHGYYFGRVPGSQQPPHHFTANGKDFEIFWTVNDGKGRYNSTLSFREVGGKQEFTIKLTKLIFKLTGAKV